VTVLLVTALVVGFFVVAFLIYLLGFRLGSQSWICELQRVRAEAADAERQLHDLTRSAFVAMAEAAEQRHTGRE
jgi:hypothetical protein